MTHPVRTVLWFDKNGREAADFYCSLIPGSGVDSEFTYDNGGPDGDASGAVIDFHLGGVPYQILQAGPMFPLSECVSISVQTPDQAETDRLWDALVQGGGSHGPCGWLKDRYGLSWQIVPAAVLGYLTSSDRAVSARAFGVVMQMGKIDLAAVEAAVAGGGA
jgi:predicted 3-demethylubiquinone-9 3-methyltransferase (glyoxalase superfamily)